MAGAKAARRAAFLKAFTSRTNTFSLRKLEKIYGISHGAAVRLVHGDTKPESHAGRSTVLPGEVENELVRRLLNCAKNACAVKLDSFPHIVMTLISKMGIEAPDFVASRKWVSLFFSRHPELSKRMPSKTNQARLTHWNRISFAQWEASIGPLAKKYTPEETWNMDDTSFDLENIGSKVSPLI